MDSYNISANRKIIKLKKNKIYFDCPKKYRDNIIYINNMLAIELGFCTENKVPKRRQYRRHILKILADKGIKISCKDIKRMENPNYREIPLFIVEILLEIVTLIKENKDLNFKASDNDKRIVSVFLLEKNLEYIKKFHAFVKGFNAAYDYNAKVSGFMINEIHQKLNEFDNKYNHVFNDLFE